MKLIGEVQKRRVAKGSKSERDAIVIVCPDGEFVLRRQGANPFSDPDLDQYIGLKIQAEGVLHGQTFLASALTKSLSGAAPG